MTGILAEPILVGRKHELCELQRCLDSAIQGKGTTVFVSGDAGSGKTRLITDFLIEAKKRHVKILTGWCLSNAAVPYFPFFEAFSRFFTQEQKGVQPGFAFIPGTNPAKKESNTGEIDIAARLTSEADEITKLQTIPHHLWKDQTFAAVINTLLSVAADYPVILFIDDIHWADSASLALIHYIARSVYNQKILLIATFRREELSTDVDGKQHPLIETLRLMRREDLFREIRVAGLSSLSVSALAQNILGAEVQPELAERLMVESQGNPLFVVESLRMLFERGGLVIDCGVWHLTSDKFDVPAKIKDIILQRLGTLSRNNREVLEAASVIGEKFSIEVLANVLGQDYLGTVKALDVIASSTSLVVSDQDTYRFDHARSQVAIYDSISPALQRGYHTKIAESLEKISGSKLPVNDLAYHFAEAGNKDKAVKYTLAAGENELARWSNNEAVKHFTYVLETVGEDPAYSRKKFRALEGLGDALFSNCMLKKSMKTFEMLADKAETSEMKLRALRKAMESAFQHGDPKHLMELVKKAEPFAAVDRLENARIIHARARALAGQMNMKTAFLEECKDSLQVFEEEYALWDAAFVMISAGLAYTINDMPLQGIAYSLRAINLFGELEDYRWQSEAYWVAGIVFMICLQENEALRMYLKVIEVDEEMKIGDYNRLIHAYVNSSEVATFLGDFQAAYDFSLKAFELSKKTDSVWVNYELWSNLTKQYALRGDIGRANEYFQRLNPVFGSLSVYGYKINEAIISAYGGNEEKSRKYFKELFAYNKTTHAGLFVQVSAGLLYAWVLEKLGHLKEAQAQRKKQNKICQDAEVKFQKANLSARLMVQRNVVVGEEFEMHLDLVNVGKKSVLLLTIANAVPLGFNVASLPAGYSLQNGNLKLKESTLGPFQVKTAKPKILVNKAGSYILSPEVNFVGGDGMPQAIKLTPIIVEAQPAPPKYEVLPKRVATGNFQLDELLFGGLPENSAVVLTASSSNERQSVIAGFLETGAAVGQITLYVTRDFQAANDVASKFPNVGVVVCSPQADHFVGDHPKFYKLKGVDNLTDIDIALTKLLRTLDKGQIAAKRAVVDLVSDVLLTHHAVVSRKWLSGLLSNLKSRGFTTLAVLDTCMHSPEEANAMVGLFDGEIQINTKTDSRDKTIRVARLYKERYLDKEVAFVKEK
jgi:KaiC/GvpD/RAD55 family RecA-like ATPase/tetratricopeptide (TPR) repeat protein